MDLKFSEMSVDTSLAQEYLKKHEALLELYNDYKTIKKNKLYYYHGEQFREDDPELFQGHLLDVQIVLQNMARCLQQNAVLITQIEYHFRNIPIEDTKTQLGLIIQYFKCISQLPVKSLSLKRFYQFVGVKDPLLVFGTLLCWVDPKAWLYIQSQSKETAVICHLFATLWYEAGYKDVVVEFLIGEDNLSKKEISHYPVKDLNSGTVAVVSEDADVDSAVDKFILVSKQVPWRLRRILVQESIYQLFKDALRWKCELKTPKSKPLTSDVLCAETLNYNDRTFLIDPVELSEDEPTVVTVEAYRTTKEVIDLVKLDKARYLSLWTNGIAEINEFIHSTKAPVVWVNNVADFRGPPQVSFPVFNHIYSSDPYVGVKKCAQVAKLCDLTQSWLKLDWESRRDVLCGVLDKCRLLNPKHEVYTEIKKSLYCSLNSFIHVGKDYVCMGMLEPLGIIDFPSGGEILSTATFRSILQGNALLFRWLAERNQEVFALLEQAGVPVVYLNVDDGDFKVFSWGMIGPTLTHPTRVSWTNSGTIFAN